MCDVAPFPGTPPESYCLLTPDCTARRADAAPGAALAATASTSSVNQLAWGWNAAPLMSTKVDTPARPRRQAMFRLLGLNKHQRSLTAQLRLIYEVLGVAPQHLKKCDTMQDAGDRIENKK